VDFSDLVALLVLPLGFFYVPSHSVKIKLNPLPIAFLTVISFCATSIPQPTQVFTQPQYLLFKPGILKIEDTDYPSNYQVYDIDSLLVIRVKEIEIDKRAAIDDEYHKAQILKDLDLRLLKAAKEPYGSATALQDYIHLRDSLSVREVISVVLPLDSVTEHLRFSGTRLHGRFARFSRTGKLLIDGRYKNGIEDSVWSFYDAESRLIARKYFVKGELTKTESFENAILISDREHNTRQVTIRNKYFHLVIIALLIVAFVSKLVLNYKHSGQQDTIRLSGFWKIAGSAGLPIVVFIFAKFISSLVPNSYSPFFLGIFGEAILVCVVALPLFLVIFFVLKLRSWFDLALYVLLFALLMVLIEESIYLRDISS
jgi:hypothetical protein